MNRLLDGWLLFGMVCCSKYHFQEREKKSPTKKVTKSEHNGFYTEAKEIISYTQSYLLFNKR